MAFVLQNRARLCFEYFYDIGEKNPLSTFSTLRILRTLHIHAPSALSLRIPPHSLPAVRGGLYWCTERTVGV